MLDFKYLGSEIPSPNDQTKDEIKNRMTICSLREITRKTKFLIYITSVRSIMLYGLETWPMKEVDY